MSPFEKEEPEPSDNVPPCGSAGTNAHTPTILATWPISNGMELRWRSACVPVRVQRESRVPPPGVCCMRTGKCTRVLCLEKDGAKRAVPGSWRRVAQERHPAPLTLAKESTPVLCRLPLHSDRSAPTPGLSLPLFRFGHTTPEDHPPGPAHPQERRCPRGERGRYRATGRSDRHVRADLAR